MHKKVIKGITYYYTSVRENGRVKTIYLGRDKRDARKKEMGIKGIPETPYFGAPKMKLFTIISLLIIVSASLFFMQGYTGYLTLSTPENYLAGESLTGTVDIHFLSAELYPADSIVEISIGEQTIQKPLSEILTETDEVHLGVGEYYVEDSDISGEGLGFGIEGEKTIYPTVAFSYNLLVYVTETVLVLYNTTNTTIQEIFNETTNQTENITIEETITLYNETNKTTFLDSMIIEASCDYENLYIHTINTNPTNNTNATYEVSIVPETVKVGDETIDESHVSLVIDSETITAETDYYETLVGFGKGFETETESTVSLPIEDFGLTAPEESGDQSVNVKLLYIGTILKETENGVTVTILETEDPEPVPEVQNETVNA
ncbi:MAG: hypothetical protein KAS04_04845, partial [Candidatus Aenigmarchaeota archaeon]|nr:hypothetical protein [Candidatus Aenigmarchaeota archaeon]